MSSVREYHDEEEAELIDDPELDAELEAGIEELDRGEWIDGDELLHRLRNGEYDAPVDRRPPC
jgi:hypothetical protein